MASPPNHDNEPPLPPVKFDYPAAALSYVVPGLGQIYQGRVGKGLLFFFGLYLLFFYGMWMGNWRNVWLPDTEDLPDVQFLGVNMPGPAKAVSYRWQFLGQVWIGAAAWPGVFQYAVFDRTKDEGPIFGKFERMPDEKELNDLQRNGNKRWDLGWVYTVIAGVLNLLVIYDALAGPMFREPPPDWVANDSEDATGAATPVASVPMVPPVSEPPAASEPPLMPPVPTAPPAPTTEGGAR